MTIVFFRARTVFTAPITRDFWRKFREDPLPFSPVTAVGAAHKGFFSGCIDLEIGRRPSLDALAYEITSALVQKVELLSRVGVTNIEFDEITFETAYEKNVLHHKLPNVVIRPPRPEKRTSVKAIQRAACDHFNISLEELKSHRRNLVFTLPRMIAMYICRQRLKLSFPKIGRRFGGKNHTTVMSAVKKIGRLVEKSERVRTMVADVERKAGLRALQ